MKPLTKLLDRFSGAFKSPSPAVLAAQPPHAPSADEAPASDCPPRLVEGRREFHGLLWFPVLTVRDDGKLVVAAKAGLPHCLRCERPLALAAGAREEWACASCGERRPGSEADFFVAESMLAEGIKEFFAVHPGFRLAPGLSALQRGVPA
jgi:ribosomal protein L37AE/L43A